MAKPSRYPFEIQAAHWAVAAGVGTLVYLVKSAQWTNKDDTQSKVRYMNLHKSVGLCTLGLSLLRLSLVFRAEQADQLPEPINSLFDLSKKEESVKYFYILLDTCIIFEGLTGITMGYFSGKGLPFFGYQIPGAEDSKPSVAGFAFRWHKRVGTALQIFTVMHLIGNIAHQIVGDSIIYRMLPESILAQ